MNTPFNFNNKQKNRRSTLMCVAPFNNPHIVPFYKELHRINEFDTTLVSLTPLAKDRLSLGWPEMAENNEPWLQPWRSTKDRWQYLKKLITADLVLFPGFFHHSLPLHHILRRFTFRKSMLWSEPILSHPRTQKQSKLKMLARRCLLKICNSPNFTLLAMGAYAEDDFRKLGMSKWNYRQFLFTVAMDMDISNAQLPSVKNTGLRKIVYCGGLSHRKGVDLLINAVSQITFDDHPFHVSIIGDGPEKQSLQKLTADLGIQNRIDFLGSQPLGSIYSLLREQDVLVLPSRYDGWGAVINEAMECSLAVITSDSTGSRRPLVSEGVNGYVFKSNSYLDLHKKLMMAISDTDHLDQLKVGSRTRISGFSPKAVAGEFIRFCGAEISGTNFSPSSEILSSV